jgi:hypothetical protein
MSKQLDATAKEIRQLHAELFALAKTSLDKAICIGQLLYDVKGRLKHGEWLPWLKNNVPFSQSSAFRYMSCYSRRKELKKVKVADLGDAYALLYQPAELTKTSGEVELAKRFAREQGLKGELELLPGGVEQCGMRYGPSLRHVHKAKDIDEVTIIEIGDDWNPPYISQQTPPAAERRGKKDGARGRERAMQNFPRLVEKYLPRWLKAIKKYDSGRDEAKGLGKFVIQFGHEMIKQGNRLINGK